MMNMVSEALKALTKSLQNEDRTQNRENRREERVDDIRFKAEVALPKSSCRSGQTF